jgi:hypothetical protein
MMKPYVTCILLLAVWHSSAQLLAQTELQQRDEFAMCLRSSNDAPVLSEAKRATFPSNFDWQDYERIETEIRRLLRDVPSTLPQLTEALDDKHYCTTIRGPSGAARNYTVGDVCQEILCHAITEAYYKHLKPESKMLLAKMRRPSFMRSKTEFKRWLDDRQNKNLWELQAEIAELSLAMLSDSSITNEIEPEILEKWKVAIGQQIASLRDKKVTVESRWLEGDSFHFYTRK